MTSEVIVDKRSDNGDIDEQPLTKRQKLNIPEGMSKNQWKKLQKEKRWEETKEQYRELKREKRKAAKLRKREAIKNSSPEDTNYHQLKKKQIPSKQIKTNVNVIMDCEFDELMTNKEIVSMSNQIARSYSAKRHCDYEVGLTISSFNKNLKNRFDNSVDQYFNWTNIEFKENDHLEDLLPKDPEERSKYVYLTADTDTILESLDEGHTYIIGGIVDKNRHKKLCLEKAERLGLKVGKLPIDKYIELNGRQVLATSHVFELCCKWFEEGKDWKKAFDEVLPPRKMKKDEEKKSQDEDDESEEEEVTKSEVESEEVPKSEEVTKSEEVSKSEVVSKSEESEKSEDVTKSED
ncbi:tRNA (guanine(9)-N1)-methyltransferase [[Candida] anglica]